MYNNVLTHRKYLVSKYPIQWYAKSDTPEYFVLLSSLRVLQGSIFLTLVALTFECSTYSKMSVFAQSNRACLKIYNFKESHLGNFIEIPFIEKLAIHYGVVRL